jgi:hypothetical protein
MALKQLPLYINHCSTSDRPSSAAEWVFIQHVMASGQLAPRISKAPPLQRHGRQQTGQQGRLIGILVRCHCSNRGSMASRQVAPRISKAPPLQHK